MSAALPTSENCCVASCDDVVVQNVPGPAGEDGADGTNGAAGVSSVTTLTAAFTMPAELASANAFVVSTAGFTIGENLFVQTLGTLQVTAIGSALQVTLKNVEDTASGAYVSNAAPATVAPIGSRISPTGLQGPAGLLAGAAAGGNLKGTYPNPLLLIPNALGALAVGNGTDANSLSAGTNGQLPAYDSTQPLGLLPKSILPITGGTNVAADRVVRLSSATGLPIALQASKASIKNPGGAGVLVADASSGDARGTDAVDLQVTRAGVSQVASGNRAVIAGGQNNAALGTECTIAGGENNIAGAVGKNHATVAGGSTNSATGQESVVCGGQNNVASNTQSTVCGGDTNVVDATEAFIGGGAGNTVHSPDSAICSGVGNTILGGKASQFIGAGDTNTSAGDYAVIAGGNSNTISEDYASIAGGKLATADKYGQRAFAAGDFATNGDCQQSDLIWRCSTVGIVVATEMFLDGASKRATVASGRTVAFDILLTARSSAGLNAAWTVKGIVNNLGGTTSIATAVVTALIADNSGATFGTLANVPVVSADDAHDALVIKVSNPAATNVRWAGHGRLLEVGY